ncbi:DsbA family protein [Streptomyces sp. NPDC059169]|uniref:DsbA family protein n=1 Tax=Streptomyces sp. NPDC059169 TaxID=3346754 RepID=UPI0036CC55AC
MPDSRSRTSLKPFALGAAVAAAAVALGVASYMATAPDSSPSGEVTDASTEQGSGAFSELEKLARRAPGDPLALGRADAPVVLVEYADFKCGYCGKFARDTQPALVKKYVDNGTLRIEWRNFPIFGEESESAARASWAAGQQGRFWQFHDTAYAADAKEKGFGEARLQEIARQAGVKDLSLFARDANSEAARQAVARDQEEGYSLGATSTPSFLVNGRPIAGAQSVQTFVDAIEAARRAADPGQAAGPGVPSGAADPSASRGPSVPAGAPERPTGAAEGSSR